MNKLRKEIDELSDIAIINNIPQHKYPFYKNIIQVDFNAWNYVESDLWASLAQNIYQALYEHQNNGAGFNEYWLNVIKYGEKKSKALEQNLEGIREDLKNKSDEISKIEANLSEFYQGIEISDVSKIIRENFKDDLPKSISSILSHLESTEETIHGLSKVNEELSQISLQGLFKSSLKRIGEPVTKSYIIFFFLITFIILVIGYANPLALESFTTNLFTSMGTFFTALLTFGNAHLQKALSWLKKIKKVKESIGALIKKEHQNFDNEIENFKTLNLKLNKAITEKSSIESEINMAKKSLGFLTPEMLIKDHISNTIDDNRYGKHLGLPALLNKDFTELANAIILQNEALNDSEKFPSIDDELKAYSNHPHVNRIVLYIDDLDRCPPKVVVKVLEAINLFMASPLFIVVIGVDPRWLFSSLREYYSELMTPENSEDDDCLDISTPEEYLEKIFQVPIWLQRPDTESVRSLINSIIGKIIVPDAQEKEEEHTSNENVNSEIKKEEKSETELTSNNEAETENENELKETNNKIKTATHVTDLESEALSRAQLQNLTNVEVEYIQKLAPILGRSPRAIKRYLNLYRIIKTSLSEEKFNQMFSATGIGTEGYKTISILLSIVVGWPRISSFIFEVINVDTDESVSINTLIKKLELKIETLASKNIDDEQLKEKNYDRYWTLLKKEKAQIALFERFKNNIMEIDSKTRNEILDPLCNWNKEVARFSYNKLQDF
jgi:hypothetical protein